MPIWIPITATVGAFVISAILAWWRGSLADRLVASGFLADTLASLLLNDPDVWTRIQIYSFLIDLALLILLGVVVVRWAALDRLALTSLQLVLVCAHVARALPSFDTGGGYAVTTAILTYLQALALLVTMIGRAWLGRDSGPSSK